MRYILLFLLAACTGATEVTTDTTAAQYSMVGAYQLKRWNGQTLPARIATGSPTNPRAFEDVYDGAMSIGGTGTFTRASTFKVTWRGDSVTYETRAQGGTFTGNVDTGPLVLSVGGVTLTATIKGDSLTLWCCGTSNTESWVYVR